MQYMQLIHIPYLTHLSASLMLAIVYVGPYQL